MTPSAPRSKIWKTRSSITCCSRWTTFSSTGWQEVEGKDGNPLNEVRILCNSMLLNQNIMATSYPRPHASALGDKSIKLSPEKSVLKRQFGDEIRLTEADFSRMSGAFFEEMERKFAG